MTSRTGSATPSTTRAVVATDYGSPAVLRVMEQPLVAPGPGEALLDVRAAGVNPADAKMYSGQWGRSPSALPMRLGFEVSGTVRALGPDAVGPLGPLAVGDDVIAFRISGGYAEQVVVPASALIPKPASLDWSAAAGLMLTGATAAHTVAATGVGSGDTVLVHGASGGVGLIAVQLAAAAGATVIGTARPANHAVLAELGVTPVAYGPGLAQRVRALAPSGIDAAIDTIGTDEAVDVSLELVADRQRIATIAAFERGGAAGIRLLGGGPGADPGDELRMRVRTDLAARAGAGELRVLVAAEFALDDVAAAHETLLAGGHRPGKLILTVN